MAEKITDRLYQVAIGGRWKFTFIHAQDEEDLIRYLAENHPTRSDIFGANEILKDGTTRTAKIISHPLFQKLYGENEKTGKTPKPPAGVIMLNKRPWAVTLPSDALQPETIGSWNAFLSVTGGRDELSHHKGIGSWSREKSIQSGSHDIAHSSDVSAEHSSSGGYRPVIIPLDPETLEPRPSYLLGHADGDLFRMGTLYMSGVPQENPKTPVPSGDIPDYIPGSDLQIGDSSSALSQRITWIKVGNALVSDRILMKNISWSDLDRQGLVGRTDHIISKASRETGSLEEKIHSAEVRGSSGKSVSDRSKESSKHDPSRE